MVDAVQRIMDVVGLSSFYFFAAVAAILDLAAASAEDAAEAETLAAALSSG